MDSLVSRIVLEVAEREHTDPIKLPPLFEAIDTEALETIIDGSNIQVSFTYCEYRITVTSDEELRIKPHKIHAD